MTTKKETTMKDIWKKLSSINVSKHAKVKNNLSYLAWSDAIALVMQHYPDMTYDFQVWQDNNGDGLINLELQDVLSKDNPLVPKELKGENAFNPWFYTGNILTELNQRHYNEADEEIGGRIMGIKYEGEAPGSTPIDSEKEEERIFWPIEMEKI